MRSNTFPAQLDDNNKDSAFTNNGGKKNERVVVSETEPATLKTLLKKVRSFRRLLDILNCNKSPLALTLNCHFKIFSHNGPPISQIAPYSFTSP